ncbi:lysozyme inhibitor LprI family protein [Vibrio sp. WXL103]|uniref:lysozyme inhibitor LprI family protein n=1 Tax=Vibrio sp. WXL103 TaxID=3450710 RepID=UPI003EC4B3F5
MRSIILFILALCSNLALADDNLVQLEDCYNATITPEFDDCVRKALTNSQNKLDTTMALQIKSITRSYNAAPDLGKDLVSLVEKSHRSWLEYRELNCAIKSFEIEPETPTHSTSMKICKIEMNSVREQQINSF